MAKKKPAKSKRIFSCRCLWSVSLFGLAVVAIVVTGGLLPEDVLSQSRLQDALSSPERRILATSSAESSGLPAPAAAPPAAVVAAAPAATPAESPAKSATPATPATAAATVATPAKPATATVATPATPAKPATTTVATVATSETQTDTAHVDELASRKPAGTFSIDSSGRRRERRAPSQVCHDCCNDGREIVPCFDVEACALNSSMGGRYALLYAHLSPPRWPWLGYIDSMKSQAEAIALETGGSVDVAVMLLDEDIQKLKCPHKQLIEEYGIRVIKVPWALPPALKWYPVWWTPGQILGWCGMQDLIRLHILGLEEYDAVAFFDQDIEFQGDFAPVLRCASTGRFLSASGGVGEPFNVGMFALKPDRRLLQAAELFSVNLTFDREGGSWGKGAWGGCGYAPASGHFIGADCGQGFFHTLLYKRSCKKVRQAWEAAGLPLDAIEAVQIDRCIWNYQTDANCPQKYNCDIIRGHHKPDTPPGGNDCGKWKFRKGKKVSQRRRRRSTQGSSSDCETQCVTVGKNCDCSNPDHKAVKNIKVGGIIKECEATSSNPSGDTFVFEFKGNVLSARRPNPADNCWCDGDIYVACCISNTSMASPQ